MLLVVLSTCNNGYSYQSKTSNSSKWNILTNCWAERCVSVCPHETAHGRSYDRASVRRTYAVYYVQKAAAYAEITHQRRTADF